MDVKEKRSIYIPASHFAKMSLIPAGTKEDALKEIVALTTLG